MNEIWKSIPGYPGYEASSLGRIRSLDRTIIRVASSRCAAYTVYQRGKILRPAPHGSPQNSSGHLMVMAGRGRNLEVHVAVALAFHGERPFTKAEVLHLNHDEADNIPSNLKWGTRSENLKMDWARGVLRGSAARVARGD